MNDNERQDYVNNDEGLFKMQQRAKNKRKWLHDNRALIDEVFAKVNSGEKRQHYLTYG